jgi:hypothetical protein
MITSCLRTELLAYLEKTLTDGQKAEESHRCVVQAFTQRFAENTDTLSPCEL